METMTESNTIQVTQDDSSNNYTIYESADGDTIVGMYVEDSVAEQIGEFAAVTISDATDASDEATAEKKKDTSNYGVFELPPAITGMYVSHDSLDSEESEDSGPTAPDAVGLSLAASDEETFENSLPDPEEQAEALVESESESEPSAEEQAEALVTEGDSPSEDVEIADEEIGL